MTGIRRAVIGALAALTAVIGTVSVASPAQADVPPTCANHDYANGRRVATTNANNGGGAEVGAVLCWTPLGNGYYDTYIYYWVTDTAANGAGATIRVEWTGTDGAVHYDVPPSSDRAWSNGETVVAEWGRYNIKALYVRACLTNANNEGHHCGPRA